MDVYHAYNFGTSAYLAIQSLPLLLTPKVIVSMLAAEPRRITDLETYLSRSQGLLLLAFASLNLLLTGTIPSTNSWDNTPSSASSDLSGNPYAFPTVVVTATYHALTAFYIYAQTTSRGGGSFAFYAGLVFSASLFCVAVWVILFGSDKGRISKKTGADKRTGNFPFTNQESAREIKKEAKKEDKEGRKEERGKSGRKSVARTSSSR